MSQKPKKVRVALIGGGIGGLCFAIGVLKNHTANIELEIFEAAPSFGEIGAGVGFGPNAYNVIKNLGFAEEYEKIAVFARDTVSAKYSYGNADLAKGGKASHRRGDDSTNSSTVHRAYFMDLLVSLLPPRICHHSKRLESLVETQDGVDLTFMDGSTHQADIVVGADGVKSIVRKHIFAGDPLVKAEPVYTGTKAYRGLVPMKKAIEIIGEDIRIHNNVYGRGKHIITFAITEAKILNIVAFVSDRSSPRPVWPHKEWIVNCSKEEMLADWSDWSEDWQQLLSLIDEPKCWALHQLIPLPTYSKGRLVLLGDAAHAMLPHHGAGAGQAVEDGYMLSQLLTDADMTVDKALKAIQVYSEFRQPRANRVVNMSKSSGEIYELHNPLGLDIDLAAKEIHDRYDWIWGHGQNEDVSKAKVVLHQRS